MALNSVLTRNLLGVCMYINKLIISLILLRFSFSCAKFWHALSTAFMLDVER